MNKIKILSLLTIFIATSFNFTFGQGCSDAGFCSAGTLNSQHGNDSISNGFVALKLSYGAGEEGVSIIQVSPELEWNISKSSTIQASVPYVFATGNLGDNSGIGDVNVNYSYRFYQNEKIKAGVTIGFKLPTGKTDASYINDVSFPMPYQTGLGTYDLIVGASMVYQKWALALGYQSVIKNDNKNNFGSIPVFAPESSDYFRSNKLDRGDDALLRLGRLFKINNTSITPGVLAIYRVNKDKVTSLFGDVIELEGSDGLTLNVTISALVPINKKFSLLLEAGAPAIVRDVRADGLTRSFVGSASLRYNF